MLLSNMLPSKLNKYAYEIATYADIPKSLTWSGLVSLRWSHERKSWSKVIAGSNSDLAKIIRLYIRLSPVNFNVTEEAAEALALYLADDFENVISDGVSDDMVRLWYAAWNAATKTKGEPQ
jgi:hypothetical protein